MAALIPPARKHMVRYYGALGPRSPVRGALSGATHEGWEIAFPKTKGSRAPPGESDGRGEGSQVHGRIEAVDGRKMSLRGDAGALAFGRGRGYAVRM